MSIYMNDMLTKNSLETEQILQLMAGHLSNPGFNMTNSNTYIKSEPVMAMPAMINPLQLCGGGGGAFMPPAIAIMQQQQQRQHTMTSSEQIILSLLLNPISHNLPLNLSRECSNSMMKCINCNQEDATKETFYCTICQTRLLHNLMKNLSQQKPLTMDHLFVSNHQQQPTRQLGAALSDKLDEMTADSTVAIQAKRYNCSNCGTDSTTMWRRGPDNEIVCNACGLYFKLHRVNRPKSMRQRVIRPRRRRSTMVKDGYCTSPNSSSQSQHSLQDSSCTTAASAQSTTLQIKPEEHSPTC